MPRRALVPTSRRRDPPPTDDDGLLRVALDEDVDPHVEQRVVGAAALARHDLLDDDRQAVRQLVAHALEGGLADELGDHHLLGLVGEHPVGVERPGRGRQVAREHRRHLLDLVAAGRRARHDRGPVAELVDGDEVLGQALAVDGVGLGGERHDGRASCRA